MRAGTLRHVVRLQKQVFTSDGQGGYSKDWADFDSVHAQVLGGSGSELLHAGQLEYTLSYRISMRYRTDLTPAQRLIWTDGSIDHILDILQVSNPDGHRRELLVMAVERVPTPGPET